MIAAQQDRGGRMHPAAGLLAEDAAHRQHPQHAVERIGIDTGLRSDGGRRPGAVTDVIGDTCVGQDMQAARDEMGSAELIEQRCGRLMVGSIGQ